MFRFNHLIGFVKDLTITFLGFTAGAKTLVLRQIQYFFKALHRLSQLLIERL
jgi:hypothetical protein